MEGARQGLFSPTNADGLGPEAAAAAAGGSSGRPRASLSSKLSMAPEVAFAREAECGVCTKSFNILRRRHHCRSCHIAVCKECGCKAFDRKKPERSRAQWYCLGCLEADESLEVARPRATSSKRRSFSAAPSAPQLTSLASNAKFCIECGYELPPRVKFCIECGTAVRPQLQSPVSVDGIGIPVGTGDTNGDAAGQSNNARSSNLTIIDENSGAPTELTDGSEEETTTSTEQQDCEADQQADNSLPEDSELASKAREYAELVAKLQAENEKLRSRVEKFKRKMTESERRRQLMEEEHAREVTEASAAAAAAATAAAESQANNRAVAEPAAARSDALASNGPGVAAKDHPDYLKFFKLLSMGLPEEQVKMKMEAAGVDPSVLDDPDAIIGGAAPSSNGAAPSSGGGAGVAAKDHPDYLKFFKLLSMGLPAEQVKMKMEAAGVDPSVLDDPDAIIGGAAAASSGSTGGTLVKDDEQYAKFFKLLKMGMPAEQVKLKMSAGGLDPELLDTPDAVMPGSGGAGASSQAMTIKEDPAYEKFFKLMKMGMPAEQVKMKMTAAGLDADLLDTPDAPSPNQKSGGGGGVLSGLPPPTAAVKVDSSALKASLASKVKKSVQKKPEEPQLPKKEPVKPNVELRPLFWTRVPVNVVSSTVWMKLSDSHAELDVDEMEWMFRKNPVDLSKKAEEKKKDASKEPPQPKEVLLLDPKRQQNVSIAIARFKMSSEEIKKAIYALDGKKLGSEVLNVLISISPTLEEIDLLKNYDGDVNLLGNVEKFFLDLLTIPRYTQRIKCFRYKLQFEHRILETQAQLDTLVAATDQVSESDKFRRVLEHILAIGNYLNGSTPRGGAYGFKLDTLTKLHTLKSVDPRVTLMHYLLRQLEEKAPDAITFAGEVPHIPEAKRLSLDQLRADLSSYNTELAMLKGQVRASKNDSIEGDRFYEVMTPFAKDAEEVLEELGRDFNGLETSYQELIGSFGEDPRKVGPMEFFRIMDEFVTEFKKAYRQNQTKEYQAIYEEAAAARAAAEAEKAERLKQEAEERQRLEEERQQNSQETKAIYAQIIATITAWAEAHAPGNEDAVVEQFKAASRKFGMDEISADEFCDQVRQCVGSKTASKIIPNSAKLLSDEAKQTALLEALERFKEQVKKEKDAKKQRNSPAPQARSRAGSSSAGRKRGNKLKMPLPIEDIEPVVGEEAQLLHKSILEAVLQAFGGDTKKMKSFTSHTRKYGNEQITAREFYQYLTASFEPDFVGRLVPDLARLLQDAEKRHALIRALCESAPGWVRFSGL